LFNEINILPTYSPNNPRAIRITPEKIVTIIIMVAYPEGTVLSTILSTKVIKATTKPKTDNIHPKPSDTLKGITEKPVNILDQTCRSFFIVYPDFP
jgi:hypothetical protein